MSSKKPTILLCWPYHRNHFINFFRPFENDFEFIYLNWASKKQEIGSFTTCKKIYFLDYRNIQELIKDVQPVKVVFMGVEGLGILLNLYCKRNNIPTYFLQHGVFHPYEAYVEEESLARQKEKLTGKGIPFEAADTKGQVNFLKRSFSLSLLPAYVTVAKLKGLERFFNSKQKAFYHTRDTARLPTKSIVFTRFCSSVLVERDGVKNADIIEIGNPEADDILKRINTESSSEIAHDFLLLIDDPLAETTEWAGIFPVEVVIAYHNKLNQYALSQNKKLVIKLHPDNYHSTWLLKHDNIIYARESNVANLFKFSSGVFGGTSTLLIPALFTKPCCIFKLNEKYALHNFLEENNYCTVLDYQNFNIKDISFNPELSSENKAKFIKAYLFSSDMGSLFRLGNILGS